VRRASNVRGAKGLGRAACVVCAFASVATAGDLLSDGVAWYEDDRRSIEQPIGRSPNLLRDKIHTTFVLPVRRHSSPSAGIRSIGSWVGRNKVPPAENVNALDEALNSTWFTNRIGLFPLTPEDVRRGPGRGDGPTRDGLWTIVSAKTEGVTPGFNVRDPRGDVYVIKFDPPGSAGLTTGPGAIVGRIFHAAGYNVPEDAIVTFSREQLELASDIRIVDDGIERTMTESDLDEILARASRLETGEFLAIASKFLPGTPVGPFNYRGRREDDANDRIDHQNRRELRGLRLFAAWLGHFDTKQHNSLDMYVDEDGQRFLRHYLIDFASTLGAGASGAEPIHSMEYGFDGPQTLARLLALGLHEDDWRRLSRPEDLSEIGYFSSEYFDPQGFKPLTPNTSFAMMTDRDGYWAAKIISAFTDEHLAAVCEAARYRDPRATAWVARVLAERRDIIAREWFTRVAPIDFFRIDGDSLVATDLGVERGLWSKGQTHYRVRGYPVSEGREPASIPPWTRTEEIVRELPAEARSNAFYAVEYQVDRGEGWSDSVVAYLAAANGRVVAIDR
jgi:hypothetical protein